MSASPSQASEFTYQPLDRPEPPEMVRLGLEMERRGIEPPAHVRALTSEFRRRGLVGRRMGSREPFELSSEAVARRGAMRQQQIARQQQQRPEQVGLMEGIQQRIDADIAGEPQPTGQMDRARYVAQRDQQYRDQLAQAYAVTPRRWDQDTAPGFVQRLMTGGNLTPEERREFEATLDPELMEAQRDDFAQEWEDQNSPAAQLADEREQLAQQLRAEYLDRWPASTDQEVYQHVQQELARAGYSPSYAGRLPAAGVPEMPVEEPEAAVDQAGILGYPLAVLQGGAEAGSRLTRTVGSAVVGGAGWALDSDTLRDMSSAIQQYYKGVNFAPSKSRGKQFAKILGSGAYDLVTLAATGMGAGAAARAAGASNRLARLASLTLSSGGIGTLEGVNAYDSIYEDLRDKGYEDSVANQRAIQGGIAVGIINSLFERIPAGEFIARNAGTVGRLRGAFRGLVTEGGTEAAQEMTGILAELEAAAGDRLIDWNNVERVLTAAAAGGVLGGGAGAITQGRGVGADISDQADAEVAEIRRLVQEKAAQQQQRNPGGRQTRPDAPTSQAVASAGPRGPRIIANAQQMRRWAEKIMPDQPEQVARLEQAVKDVGERFRRVEVPGLFLGVTPDPNAPPIPAEKVQQLRDITEADRAQQSPIVAVPKEGGQGLEIIDGRARFTAGGPGRQYVAYVPNSIADQIEAGTFTVSEPVPPEAPPPEAPPPEAVQPGQQAPRGEQPGEAPAAGSSAPAAITPDTTLTGEQLTAMDDAQGGQLAEAAGVQYEGMQEVDEGEPPLAVFTDPETQSTFMVGEGQSVTQQRDATRQKFQGQRRGQQGGQQQVEPPQDSELSNLRRVAEQAIGSGEPAVMREVARRLRGLADRRRQGRLTSRKRASAQAAEQLADRLEQQATQRSRGREGTAPETPESPTPSPESVTTPESEGESAPPPSSQMQQLEAMGEGLAQLKADIDALARQGRENPVTGGLNRRAFDELLDKAKQQADAENTPFALVAFDAANLKTVNDTRGDAAGDAYLKRVWQALESVTRSGTDGRRADAFHYGGDEFAMLVYGANREQAEAIRTRAEEALTPEEVVPGVSTFLVGDVAAYEPGSDTAPETLVKEATDAMKARKKRAKAQMGEATTREEAEAAQAAAPPESAPMGVRANLEALGPVPIVQVEPVEFGGESNAERRTAQRKWAMANLAGAYTNSDTGWDIDISGRGIDHTIAEGDPVSTARTLPALPRLLETARRVEATAPERDNPDIRAYHRFVGAARVGDQAYRVLITVREMADGKRFYNHDATAIKRIEKPPDVPGTDAEGRSPSRAAALSMRDALAGFNARSTGNPYIAQEKPPGLSHAGRSESATSDRAASESIDPDAPRRARQPRIEDAETTAGAEPRDTYQGPAAYVAEAPETEGGAKLLKQFQNDPGGRRTGLRTIIDYLNPVFRAEMRVGREQLGAKTPAHYEPKPHLVRTRSGAAQVNIHELGHAFANSAGRADERFGRLLQEHEGRLVEMTRRDRDNFASAETEHEGFAELMRLMVTNPRAVPEGLGQAFSAYLDENHAPIAQAIRDAHRLFAAHMGRPIEAQWASLSKVKGARTPLAERIRDATHATLYNLTNAETALVYRLQEPLYKAAGEWGRKTTSGIGDHIKKVRDAGHMLWHITSDATQAVYGGASGDQRGASVIASGEAFNDLTEAERATLIEAGAGLPDSPGHGNRMALTDFTLNDIAKAVGSQQWEAFEGYVQARAALSRWETKELPYPGYDGEVPPAKLRQLVEEMERSHPAWAEQADRVQQFMNQLLLLNVLSGEITADQYQTIVETYDHYAPLPRDVERGERGMGGTAGTLFSGLMRAHGSPLGFTSLQEAVERRVRSAYQAYYHNRLRNQVKRMQDDIRAMEDVPDEAKWAADRFMVTLRPDIQRAATLSVSEMQQVVADYLNEQRAEQQGVSVEELAEDDLVAPADVDISPPGKPIFRATSPRAVHVLTRFEGGKVAFEQVEDRTLYDFFTRSESPNAWIGAFSKFASGPVEPWKQSITQSVGFIPRAVFRDLFGNVLLGEGAESLVPGFYWFHGILNKIRGLKGGGEPAARLNTELLSRSLEHTADRDQKLAGNRFMEILREGIAVRDWAEMSLGQKALLLPGQVMHGVLKPLQMLHWATGIRWVAQKTETIPREGSAVRAKQRGETDESGQRHYDAISGNFIARPGNPTIAAVWRMGGFFNPAVQVITQVVEKATTRRDAREFYATKIPTLGVYGAMGAVITYLLMDDEEREQWREMPDETRARFMPIKVPGLPLIRMPMPYGPEGAAVSFGFNAVMGQLTESGTDNSEMARFMLTRIFDLPGVTDLLTPIGKTALEAKANYSFWYGDAIVPAWMRTYYSGSPELQAYESTPEVYRRLGAMLDTSPIMAEYVVDNVFGTQVESTILALDKVVGGEETHQEADLPFVGGLFWRPTIGYRSRSVKKVGDLSQRYENLQERIERLRESNPDAPHITELERQVGDLQPFHDRYQSIRALASEARRLRQRKDPNHDRIRRVQEEMVSLARETLEQVQQGD